MKIPIMICGFKRPECLLKVVEAVKAIGAEKLYLVLDAPRIGRGDDLAGYTACKKIFNNIDWTCEVHRNYAKENMGCGKRMTTGISWVFKQEEMAIILEDDCVPHPTFFRYCSELLERYKDDGRVAAINGHDEHLHLGSIDFHGYSYYFDRMMSCWGWATWRRAWQLHDPTLSYLAELCDAESVRNIIDSKREYKRWYDNIWRIHDGKKNTWAGAWATTIYKEGMLVIHPTVNLVTNVGYENTSRNQSVTSTNGMRFVHRAPFSSRKLVPMTFPMKHPIAIVINRQSERFCLSDALYATTWAKIVRDPIGAMLRLCEIVGRYIQPKKKNHDHTDGSGDVHVISSV